jgi:hypothetical protein
MLDTKLRQVISSRGNDFKPYDRYGDPIPSNVSSCAWMQGQARNRTSTWVSKNSW